MYKRLKDMDLENKKVVLRCDLNVPIENGTILDDNKIVASLDTIKYLIDKNCKIIILSHLGKIKTKSDLKKYTLKPVAEKLLHLIRAIPEYHNLRVVFSNRTRSEALKEKVDALQSKDILIIENTRFEDLPSGYESNCDDELAKFWASLGDVFVNDAFASSHRLHASTAGIAKYIPSCIGLLMQKEIEALDKYIMNPEHPFTVIVGGAKLEDKINIIKNLLPKCDHLLLTGGIANTFLKALNINIGFSLYCEDEKILEDVKKMLFNYKEKIVLPFDAIVGSSYDNDYISYKAINQIDSNEIIYDLGSKTILKYKKVVNESKTIFVNGTVGKYEDERFSNGTKELLDLLTKSGANVIVGGGDATAAVHKFKKEQGMSYICTGGGASLEYITKGTLPALEFISKDEEYEILDI